MTTENQIIQEQIFNYSCLTIGILSIIFVTQMNLKIEGRIQLNDDLTDFFFEVLELA